MGILRDMERSIFRNTEQNPFASNATKCSIGKDGRAVSGRCAGYGSAVSGYGVKGVLGCSNRHIEEDTVRKIYFMAWNKLLEWREMLLPEWKEKVQGG